MKQISARQFRTSFAELAESVTVLRRDKSGNFQVLGTWTPASSGVPAAIGFGVSRPAPKPKR